MSYNNNYLSLHKKKCLTIQLSKTMDITLISGKQYLFAYCITDGILDDMSEEERTAHILEITEIKETMQKDSHPTESDRKNTKKVSK